MLGQIDKLLASAIAVLVLLIAFLLYEINAIQGSIPKITQQEMSKREGQIVAKTAPSLNLLRESVGLPPSAMKTYKDVTVSYCEYCKKLFGGLFKYDSGEE